MPDLSQRGLPSIACPADQRPTAARAGTSGTTQIISKRLPGSGRKASGARPRRFPAALRSTRAGRLRSTRYHAGQQATAARAARTRTTPVTRRHWSSAKRTAPGVPPRRFPAALRSTRAETPSPFGVLCLSGQLQCGGVLQRQLRRPASVRRERNRRLSRSQHLICSHRHRRRRDHGARQARPRRGPWTDEEWKGWWVRARPIPLSSCSPITSGPRSR